MKRLCEILTTHHHHHKAGTDDDSNMFSLKMLWVVVTGICNLRMKTPGIHGRPVALPLRQHQRDCCGGEFLRFFSTCHIVSPMLLFTCEGPNLSCLDSMTTLFQQLFGGLRKLLLGSIAGNESVEKHIFYGLNQFFF